MRRYCKGGIDLKHTRRRGVRDGDHADILFLNGRLRFTDDASLLEQAQKSSIWRAKSIAFAFNISARDIHSRLVDFLHESRPMVKPVLFAALVCAAPVCSSAQAAKIAIDMMGIGGMSAH
jgi:hypothetical protein